MDTVTYPDHRVADFIEQHFLPLRLKLKDNKALAEDYLVSWAPEVVIADVDGRIHDREEGFLPPEDFVALLSLGLGKYELHRKQYAHAAERFEEVVERHPLTEAAAQALYWLGVARYREEHDPSRLRGPWQQLARDYADSTWAKRTKIPSNA